MPDQSDPDRFERIEAAFAEAVQKQGAERAGFLKRLQADDPDVHAEVTALLAADADTDRLPEVIAELAQDVGDSERTAAASMVGHRLGPYRIEERVAEGGMGAVYLAVRAEGGFEQQVALKLIRPGLDSEMILRRFEAERQILADLSHPNIARLMDGGTTADGVPWVAMEFIDGRPIDRHCEDDALAIPDRLELFRTVCDAVAYAHRNLVVHRDIKPGNVMVTRDGVVKLLDFGIAKLLEPGPGTLSLTQTATGHRLLTPAYASPEQVRGEPVSVVSDVYSLGAVLYRLLAGAAPHRFTGTAPPSEIERVVCETVPERPSAVRQRAGHVRVARDLEGDLDTIVLKALRKEPERRYQSASELAEDLRRHLTGLPVSARPDTWRYRSGKFVRRHKLGVGVAAAFVLVLLGSATTLAVQAARLAEQRDVAELEAAKARQVSEFLVDIFNVSDPSEAKGSTVTAREVLDSAAVRLEGELGDSPEIKATLTYAIARVYRKLGLLEPSLAMTDRALTMWHEHEAGSADRTEALGLKGLLLGELGNYEAAVRILQERLRLSRRLYGTESPQTATALNELGATYSTLGRFEDAEPLLRESLAIRRRVLPAEDPELAESLLAFGAFLEARGELDEAEILVREAVQLRREVLGADAPEYALALRTLGLLLRDTGELDEAGSLFLEALEIQRHVLGPDHYETVTTLYELGGIYNEQGRYPEAERVYRDVLEIDRRTYGDEHPYIATDLNNIAGIRRIMGDVATAESLYRESMAINRSVFGDEHPEVATSMSNLGVLLAREGRPREAEPLLREALEMRQRVFGPDHNNVATSLKLYGALKVDLGQRSEGIALLDSAIAIRRAALGPGHFTLAKDMSQLAAILLEEGDLQQATQLYTAALAIQREALPPTHPDVSDSLVGLARISLASADTAAALPLLREAVSIRRQALGPDHEATRAAEAELTRAGG